MKKVLVIDDDITSNTLIERSLQNLGYEAIVANDGITGILKIENENPDLVLLDCHMPNLDGLSMLSELRASEKSKELPIILISSDESVRAKFAIYDILDFFPKPIDMTKLLDLINKTLGRPPE